MNINFYTKKNKKSKLTTKEIAQELNISEEKIKELERGERTLTGKTLDKYLEVVNKTDVELALENAQLKKWFEETDLKKLREEFGYDKQTALAKVLCVDQAILSRAENKNETTSISTIKTLYNFYQNDFNKKAKQKTNDNDDKKIMDWYCDFDLKRYMAVNNLTTIDLSNKTGFSPATINRLRNKKILSFATTKQLYNYVTNAPFDYEQMNENDIKIQEWYNTFNLNKFMKENKIFVKTLSKDLGLSKGTITRLRRKLPAYGNTLLKLYDYVNGYKKPKRNIEKIEEIVEEPIVEEPIVEENIIQNNTEEIETNYEDYSQGHTIGIANEEEIKQIREELKKALKQIERYEWLLDMVIDKKEI